MVYCFKYDRLRIFSPNIKNTGLNFNYSRFEEEFFRSIWECIFERVYFSKDVNINIGDIVFDTGAAVGTFSIVAAKLTGDKGIVYAFEPTDDTFGALKMNVETNKINNIIPFKEGVANEDKFLCFDERKEAFTTNRIIDDVKINNSINSGKKKIKVVSLDSFVGTNNIKRVDFVKIDVEGYALEVIQGAEDLLRRFKPKLAIACYHRRENDKEICQILMNSNDKYRVIGIKNGILFAK